LLLHQRVEKFLILQLGSFLLFLKGLLASFGVGGFTRMVSAGGSQSKLEGLIGVAAGRFLGYDDHSTLVFLFLLGGVVSTTGDFEPLSFLFNWIY
jgi:hypothetical protein